MRVAALLLLYLEHVFPGFRPDPGRYRGVLG